MIGFISLGSDAGSWSCRDGAPQIGSTGATSGTNRDRNAAACDLYGVETGGIEG
jgi:hypothetical protein